MIRSEDAQKAVPGTLVDFHAKLLLLSVELCGSPFSEPFDTTNSLLDVHEALIMPSCPHSMGEHFLEFLTRIAEQPTCQHSGHSDDLRTFFADGVATTMELSVSVACPMVMTPGLYASLTQSSARGGRSTAVNMRVFRNRGGLKATQGAG